MRDGKLIILVTLKNMTQKDIRGGKLRTRRLDTLGRRWGKNRRAEVSLATDKLPDQVRYGYCEGTHIPCNLIQLQLSVCVCVCVCVSLLLLIRDRYCKYIVSDKWRM